MSQPREARRGQSQRILQEVRLAGHQVDTQPLLYISGDDRKISNHFFERWNIKPIPPKLHRNTRCPLGQSRSCRPLSHCTQMLNVCVCVCVCR